MAGDCVPLFEPGHRITCIAAASPVGGRTFVVVDVSAGNRWPGVAVQDTKSPNIPVVTAGADVEVFGVAAFDVAKGQTVTVIRGNGMILPVRWEPPPSSPEQVSPATPTASPSRQVPASRSAVR